MTSEPYLPVRPFYATPDGQPVIEAAGHVAIPRAEHLALAARCTAAEAGHREALRAIADLQCAKPCDPVLAEAQSAYAKVIRGISDAHLADSCIPSWPAFLTQWRLRLPAPYPSLRTEYRCQYVPTDIERAQRITDAAVAFQEAVVAAREAGLVVDWNVSYGDQGRGWMDGARPHCIMIRDISRPLLPKVTKP